MQRLLLFLLLTVSPAWGATVTNYTLDNFGNPLNAPLTITPLSTPTSNGVYVVNGPARTIQPRLGAASFSLLSGNYRITQGGTSYLIAVPDDTNTYNINALASSNLVIYAYTNGLGFPGLMRISGADTTPEYLGGKVSVAGGLSMTTNTDAGNQTLAISAAALQAQIDELSGGPTNGVTATQATNIAAYQALIATNDLWAASLVMSNDLYSAAGISASEVTNISAYQALVATNDLSGGLLAGTNNWTGSNHFALLSIGGASDTNSLEVLDPAGTVTFHVGTNGVAYGDGSGLTNITGATGGGGTAWVSSTNGSLTVTTNTSGVTNTFDLAVSALSLVSTNWGIDIYTNGSYVLLSNAQPAVAGSNSVSLIPDNNITITTNVDGQLYTIGTEPDLEANQLTITNSGGLITWTLGTTISTTNIGRLIVSDDEGLGEVQADRIFASVSGTNIDAGSISTNAMDATAYAAFIGGGTADPNALTNNDARAVTFQNTLAVTNGILRVDNNRITLTNWTGTGTGPAVDGFYPTALGNTFVFGVSGSTTSTNLLGGLDVRTGTNAGVGTVQLYAKKPTGADWNVWTFEGPTGIAWGNWGGNGGWLTNIALATSAINATNFWGTLAATNFADGTISTNRMDATAYEAFMSGGNTNAIPTWNLAATNGITIYTNSDTVFLSNSVAGGPFTGDLGTNHLYANNAYLNGLHITNSGGSMLWTDRSVMTSPTNGMVRFMNYGSDAFTGLQFGPTDATNVFLLNMGNATLHLRKADGSGDGIFKGDGQGLYNLAASRVYSGAYIGDGNDIQLTNASGTAAGFTAGSFAAPKVVATGTGGSDGFWGEASNLTNLNASSLLVGTVPLARIGVGTPDSTYVLKGDNNWVVEPWLEQTNGTHRGTLTIADSGSAFTTTITASATNAVFTYGDQQLDLNETGGWVGTLTAFKAPKFLQTTNNLAYTSTTLPFAGSYTTVCSGNIDFSAGISGVVNGLDGVVKLVIFPNGSDRTVTLNTAWLTDDGSRTYYATNGQIAVLTVNTSPGVYTNAIFLPMR